MLEWVQRGLLLERRGKVIPCWWTENRKGAGTNSGESGVRNLEAESIRSRMESTGEKLKTITEIRRNNAHDTFIAENVYLLLNSLLDWEPGEKLKQRCDVISLKKNQHAVSSAVLYVTNAADRGSGQARSSSSSSSNWILTSCQPHRVTSGMHISKLFSYV